MYWYSPRRQRERNAPGADPELEGGAVAGELDQEVDRGTDDGRIEPLRRVQVVVLGDEPLEEVLAHGTVPEPVATSRS